MRFFTSILFLILTSLTFSIQAQETDYEVITVRNVQQLEEIQTLGTGGIIDARFVLNDQQIIVGSTSGLWIYNDTDLQLPPEQLYASDYAIKRMDTDRSGNLLAIAIENRAEIWDLKKRERVLRFDQFSDLIEAIDLSADGKLLIAKYNNNTQQDDYIILWDVISGEVLKEYPVPDAYTCNVLQFSPDNNQFALGCGNDIIVWSLSGEVIQSWFAHSTNQGPGVTDIFFHPDKEVLVSSGDTGDTLLSDWRTGEEILRTEQEEFGTLLAMALSPNATKIATGGGFPLSIRDMEGQLLCQADSNYVANNVSFSQDNRYLLTTSVNTFVAVYDTETCNQLSLRQDFPGNYLTAIFGKDSKTLFTVERSQWFDAPEFVRAWNLLDGSSQIIYRPEVSHRISSIAQTPDGNKLILFVEIQADSPGSETQPEYEVLNLATYEIEDVFRIPDTDGRFITEENNLWLLRHGSVFDLRFFTWNLVESREEPTFLLNMADFLTRDDIATSRLEKFTFHPSTMTVATVHQFYPLADQFYLWDIATNTPQLLSELPQNDIQALEFNNTGSLLALGITQFRDQARGPIYKIQLWNTVSKELDFELTDLPAKIVRDELIFNTDGTLLTTFTADGTLHFWNVELQSKITTLRPPSQHFSADYYLGNLKFSPDGRFLLTHGPSGVLRLWAVPSK